LMIKNDVNSIFTGSKLKVKHEVSPLDCVRVVDKRNVRKRRDGTTWTYDPPKGKHGLKPPVAPEKALVLCQTPTDPVEQNNLASELLLWVKTDQAEALEQFPLDRNMNPYKFYKIADINPYFADCLDAAGSYLGFKMVQHARKRTQDAGVIMKMLPLYNKLYGDLVMQKSHAESTKVGTVIQVIEAAVPNSDMVPVRLVSDNL